MTQKQQYIAIGVLAVVVILLLWRGCSKQQQLQEQVTLYEASQDTLHQTRNDLGQQVTSTALMEASNEKLFLDMETQDSTIMQLQGVVKDYKGKLQSASVFSNTTSAMGTEQSFITNADTIIKGDTILVYPTYESNWMSKWSSGSIKATKDSIFRDIRVKNEFEMTLGYEKEKWYKSKQPTVTILNLNPNTATTEMKTFNITTKPKKLGVGVNVSYGFGTGSFTPQFFVGVGINYNIIEIK